MTSINLNFINKNAFTFILVIIVFFSGCSGSYLAKNRSEQLHAIHLNQKAQEYLNLAETTNDLIKKHGLLLSAAELLIDANNILEGEKILVEINTNILTPSQHAILQILLAKINLSQKNIVHAKELIASIGSYQNLDNDVYKKLYLAKAEVFLQTGEILEAVQDRVNLEKFLTTQEEITENHKIIWNKLQQLTPHFLSLASQGNFSQTMQGWLTIAYITKQYDSDHTELSKALLDWQKNFPEHPANTTLELFNKSLATSNYNNSNNINMAANGLTLSKLNKIALLLPMSGTYQKSALAIKNGFLAALYNKKSHHKKPEIMILDTNNHSINNVYKQAIQDGANFIIGPLVKEDLESLTKSSRISIPTLALNTLPENHNYSNLLFQFGLLPETEANTIIDMAWENHNKNALLIVQNNDLSKRMQAAITKNWTNKGGKIINVIFINDKIDLSKTIKTALGIEDSNNRAKALAELGINFNFEPRRRQDLDCIFLLTNATIARQIKPLLNFYYASKIPVFATSSIYNGAKNPSLDQDLDGIQFCDIPWILDNTIPSHSIYQAIKQLWSKNFYQYSRLYALGVDAYKISNQLQQLLTMPEVGISGMTGTLKMDANNIISRKLMWGTFERGIARGIYKENEVTR